MFTHVLVITLGRPLGACENIYFMRALPFMQMLHVSFELAAYKDTAHRSKDVKVVQ